jgi:two-component system sensor histidine kinase DesK
MRRGGVVAQRNAAVLIWVPVLMAKPVIDAPAGTVALLDLAMAVLAAGACIVAVVDSWPGTTLRASCAWLVLALTALTGSLLWSAWAPVWLLVAMTAGVALRPRHALLAVPVCALAAVGTLFVFQDEPGSVLVQGFVVALAGTTAGVLSRLVVLTETLRRTRERLAVAAVARERDRVARDLHDVLGHTLSLMVVKAAAVRRLIESDPTAAAAHAGDIEEVGRSALSSVRQTLSNAARPTLGDELASARDALESAGIDAHLPAVAVDDAAGAEPLAWALREGVTNVLRHSQARHCWIKVSPENAGVRLTIEDDGIGVDSDSGVGGGVGLSGLRRRIEGAGGHLHTQSAQVGFTLTAWVPAISEGGA